MVTEVLVLNQNKSSVDVVFIRWPILEGASMVVHDGQVSQGSKYNDTSTTSYPRPESNQSFNEAKEFGLHRYARTLLPSWPTSLMAMLGLVPRWKCATFSRIRAASYRRPTLGSVEDRDLPRWTIFTAVARELNFGDI